MINLKYTLLIFTFILFAQLLYSQDIPKIKVKRTYNENKVLQSELYYDTLGREVNQIIFNAWDGSFEFPDDIDSAMYEYIYDTILNKKITYYYEIDNSKKTDKNILTTEYYNKQGLLIFEDYNHEALPDEYYTYNDYGDLMKDSTSEFVYFIDYMYKDSLCIIETKHKNAERKLVYYAINEYDANKRLLKEYYYNYDSLLTSITTYTYDKNNRLTKEVTKELDNYTVWFEKNDQKGWEKYEYNEYGFLTKFREKESLAFFYRREENYEYEYYK